MRIITGKYKGRIIKAPKGIRPTEDRVRKALFDILRDISGLSFLELFAGSGAVGLEALSEGAKEVIFVEKRKDCCKAIEANIESLHLHDEASVFSGDALQEIGFLSRQNRKFDLIFFDPPYYQAMAEKTLQMLEVYDILHISGFIIVQHFKKDLLPEHTGSLLLFRQEKYGDTLLSFYRKLESKGHAA